MDVTVNGTVHRWPAVGIKTGTTYQVTGGGGSGETVTVSITGISAPGTFNVASFTTLA